MESILVLFLFFSFVLTQENETAPNIRNIESFKTLNNVSKYSADYYSSNLSLNIDLNYNLLPVECYSNSSCSSLPPVCFNCSLNHFCYYGELYTIDCKPKNNIICLGNQTVTLKHNCKFCYQTKEGIEHFCEKSTNCRSNLTPVQRYLTNCSVSPQVLCLGNRHFYKMLKCNWTSGKKWGFALLFSITLGGLGVDRFYLGFWKEGLGKLFSFGGLGVWTVIDIILICCGYLTPSDGSLFL